MAAYSTTLNGLTASTSNDSATIVTTATGAGSVVKLFEIFFGGEAGSSTPVRFTLDRSTGGTTGGTDTVVAEDPSSAAAAYHGYLSWAVQPTLSGTRVLIPCFNAFGQQYKWMAAPDRPVVVGGQGAIANLSLRSLSGVPVFSGYILAEQT